MEEKKGIVGNISTKYAPWIKFCLTEDDKIWYSTKKELGFIKGDSISFKFTIQENENGGKVYKNYYLAGDATVLEKPSANTFNNQSKDEFRILIDSGNAVERAKDVLVALINKGLVTEDLDKKMNLLTGIMTENFESAKVLLDLANKKVIVPELPEIKKADTQQEIEKPQNEFPVERPEY